MRQSSQEFQHARLAWHQCQVAPQRQGTARLGVAAGTIGNDILRQRKGLTLEDYHKYWLGRLTPEEDRQIEEAIKAALLGENNRPTNTADKAVAYALQHLFERQSVVDYHDLAVTAMERSMGAALPDVILPEAKKQGILLRDSQATTKEVLAEEGRVNAFARDGRGTCRSMGSQPNLKGLSAEQQAAVRHVWESPDRVLLIRGGAGTGKTRMMRQAVNGIERPARQPRMPPRPSRNWRRMKPSRRPARASSPPGWSRSTSSADGRRGRLAYLPFCLLGGGLP